MSGKRVKTATLPATRNRAVYPVLTRPTTPHKVSPNLNSNMIVIEHLRCPLHRYTFSFRPVRSWVEQHCEGRVLNLFAGPTLRHVDEVRNDLDPAMPADFHLDA